MTQQTGKPSTLDNALADDTVTVTKQFVADEEQLRYTVTCGRVVLHEEVVDGDAYMGLQPTALISVTSYVLENGGPSRPIAFVFNGGPGSSSVWLHLGLLGPRRVVVGDPGELDSTESGSLTDNVETALAVTDLIFIDPVATGFSRVPDGSEPGKFLGYRRDVESVAEFIRLWVTRNGRWMSPRFVVGESYGALRAAALVEHLQRIHGMYFTGAILISSVLDLSSIEFHEQRNDRAHVLYVPTYAAIAHFHGKHGQRSLQDVLAEAEDFAARDYPWALSRGERLNKDQRRETLSALSRLVGLYEHYLDRANLRVEPNQFFMELLRDRNLVVGCLDGRYVGHAASALVESSTTDPFLDSVTGIFTAALHHYLHGELDYHSDIPYEIMTELPWSFQEFEGRPVDVSPLLERAMQQNPRLKVHVSFGYYDGSTPHFAAEDVLAHLRLPDQLRPNIERAYYEAGHMMYAHEASRVRQSCDIKEFIRRASASRGDSNTVVPSEGLAEKVTGFK